MPRFAQQKMLEKMIDEASLEQVLYDLAVVCHAKAERFRENKDYVVSGVLWDEHAIAVEAAERFVRESEERAKRRKQYDDQNS